MSAGKEPSVDLGISAPAPADEMQTLDAFHRGAFHLVQPQGKGHRAGLDAMLLASAVPTDFQGQLADLGAGAGAAGFAVASRCAKAQVLLVEKLPEMLHYAQASIALSINSALATRIKTLQADVELSGAAREAAGLACNSFDFIIMNPPFNPRTDRITPDPLKQAAHVMEDGLFQRWIRTAAALTRSQGEIALIARPQSLPEILFALKGRFGALCCIPVHPHQGTDAIRIIIRARKGARGALSLVPPLVLHPDNEHRFTAHANRLINGQASLFGD